MVSLAASTAILYWFHRLPYDRTREESLQEAIDRQSRRIGCRASHRATYIALCAAMEMVGYNASRNVHNLLHCEPV